MNIKVLFTGGTIQSSIKEDGFISTDDSKKNILIDTIKKEIDYDVNFDCDTVYNILSENLTAYNLIILTDKILSLQNEDIDGIIVTHGTDTLQYTGAFLSIVLKDKINFPVLLVSSDYPIDDKRANGIMNFKGALNFIKNAGKSGIYISYNNKSDGITYIHNAKFCLFHNQYDADIKSLDDNFVGKIVGDELELNNTYKDFECFSDLDFDYHKLNTCEGCICYLKMTPDMFLMDSLKIQKSSVIIETYHSGTMQVNERFFEWIKTVENVKVYILGVDDSKVFYETNKRYENLPMVILPKMAGPYAYCYVWLLETKNC